MESTIDFNILPKKILQKIPLSLRIAKDIHEFNELPNDIQYLLANYKLNTPVEINYSNVLDLKPEISIYNDIQTIQNVKELVIEYLMNHLQVLIGSYPYDVDIGSSLKYHLQTRDTTLRNTLVSNELNLIIDAITNQYKLNISIINKQYTNIQYEDRTEIQLSLTIKVDEEEFNVNLS